MSEERNLKIVATRGKTHYLLAKKRQMKTAQILDAKNKVLYPEQSLQSALRFGYWDEYKGPQDVLADLLEDVAIIEPEEGERT